MLFLSLLFLLLSLANGYLQISSGTCESHEASPLSQSSCQAAKATLADYGNFDQSGDTTPAGCFIEQYVAGGSDLITVVDDTDALHTSITYNPLTSSPIECSAKVNCVCQLKTCAAIDGEQGGAFDCTDDANRIDANPVGITCADQGDGCAADECCTVVPKTCANDGAQGEVFSCADETNSIDADPATITCADQDNGCTPTDCCTIVPEYICELQVDGTDRLLSDLPSKVVLTDSYGDGWGVNSHLSIFVNENKIKELTVTMYSTTFNFPILQFGNKLRFEYTANDYYESEKSYILYDGTDNVLLSWVYTDDTVQDYGIDRCTPCNAGSYHNIVTDSKDKIDNCVSCPDETYSNEAGQVSCISCPASEEPNNDKSGCQVKNMQVKQYGKRTSGLCTDDGGSYIETEQECITAADILGWVDDTADVGAYASYIPRGCIGRAVGSLMFNERTDTSGECSSDYECFCSFKCLPGTFQNETGELSCKQCPNGKFSWAGQSVCEDVVTDYICPAGYKKTDSTCEICPFGTYQNGPSCNLCDNGTYQSETGQSSVSACKTCAAGSYITAQSTCNSCDAGKFQEQEGQSTCESCDAGKYNDELGKTSCKSCGDLEPTGDHKDCVSIGEQAGIYYEQTDGFCTYPIDSKEECGKGAHVLGWVDINPKSDSIMVHPFGCYKTTSGMFTVNTDQMNWQYPYQKVGVFKLTSPMTTECSSDYTCVCKTICQAGTYQDQTGQAVCKSCENGKYSYRGKSSCTDICPEGMHGNTGNCDFCSTGKYHDEPSNTDCKLCTASQYQDETGLNSCKNCEQGKQATTDRTGCKFIGADGICSGSTACGDYDQYNCENDSGCVWTTDVSTGETSGVSTGVCGDCDADELAQAYQAMGQC